MAVAADIKNCPNADNMNPISWMAEAAILDVALKGSVCAAAAYRSVCFNRERLLSGVYLKFSLSQFRGKAAMRGRGLRLHHFLLFNQNPRITTFWPAGLTESWKPTWQPQDGEIRPALGEAGALPDARPPQARVRVHGRHGVVEEVFGGPLVHPRGGHDSRHPDEAEDEAHHLAESGRHAAVCGETVSNWYEGEGVTKELLCLFSAGWSLSVSVNMIMGWWSTSRITGHFLKLWNH